MGDFFGSQRSGINRYAADRSFERITGAAAGSCANADVIAYGFRYHCCHRLGHGFAVKVADQVFAVKSDYAIIPGGGFDNYIGGRDQRRFGSVAETALQTVPVKKC